MRTILRDIRAARDRDPASRSVVEVLLCYSGLHGVIGYRIAHQLWRLRLRFFSRILSQVTRFMTGVEIHPAARIGAGFFIDHGMGVVVGETTEIGQDVTIYHGVTLGGTSLQKGKRHPTLGDHVVIGASATVLGPVTIGEHSRIGAGSVVVKDVPSHSTVVGNPGRITVRREDSDFAHGSLPDPVINAVRCLTERVTELEHKLADAASRAGESSEGEK